MAKQTKKDVKKTVKKEVKSEVKNIRKDTKKFKAWWLVGLILPPVGLVLFLLWRKKDKEAAKSAGTGALISTLLWMFFGLSFLIHTNGEPKVEPEIVKVSDWHADYEAGKTIVTVLASSTCPHCQNLKPVITASSEKNGFKLYFFEGDTLNDDDYNVLTSTIELDGYEGYVPYTFVINNKKFMGSHTGEMDDSELTEFLKQTKVLK